jgi:lipoyl-dependent peroxiredoxin
MTTSNATAQWNGTLREGHGSMTPAHGSAQEFSLATRFEGKPGSNPEEMVGAALAGCFSMALTAALGQAKLVPVSVRTEAKVQLDKDGPGFKISKIELDTVVNVAGVDAEKLTAIAEETKKGCPVSKALAGTTITMTARLG